MPQTGAAGSSRSDRGSGPLPAPIVAFDPEGEIAARDNRPPTSRPPTSRFPTHAATRAAVAEDFAVRFGLEDVESTADALADRYGFRYEESQDGVPARRTVTITGRGADRVIAPGREARPVPRRRADAVVFRGDRIAMWAVLLGLLLAVAAATSGHAAVLHAIVVH
jgi:hypothetical protein